MTIEEFKTIRRSFEVGRAASDRAKMRRLVLSRMLEHVWECRLDFIKDVVLLSNKSLLHRIALSAT